MGNCQDDRAGGDSPRRWAGAAGLCAVALAVVCLVGYALQVQAVARIVPAGPVMAPTGAVMVVLAGIGLCLVAPRTAATPRRRAGQALGLVVMLYGALVLVEHLTRWDLGIDTVVFRDVVRAWSDTDTPGRPAPHTALALVVTGLAVAVLDADAGHGHRPDRVLAPAGALVAGMALLGHAYGLAYLSGTSPVNSMPYSAIAMFTALSTSILACRPERMAARVFLGAGPAGVTARRLGPVVVVTVLLIGVLTSAAGQRDLPHEGFTITAASAALMLTLYLTFLQAGRALNRADQMVRAERDFNHIVLHSLRDGVLTVGVDGEVLKATPRWCEIIGYSAQDAIGRMPPYPWWPPRLVAELTAHRARVLAGDTAVEFETSMRRADGTEVQVLISATPVYDDTGRRMLISTYCDLTERNAAEVRRRRAAEELDLFFTISTDLLCIAGADGYFKRLNPAWEHSLGYTVEELLSRPYMDLLHPDDVARTIAESQEQTQRGKVTVSFENRYRCRDGSYRWLNWNAVPTASDALVYAVARDTTEQRRSDAARMQLAAIVDGTDDAVIGIALTGIITSWNPAAERQYGYRADEATGQPIGLISPPEQPDELTQFLENIDQVHSTRVHNTVQIRKDGTRLNVAVSISAIRDGAGTVIGAASIARDISDRIRAEERFRQLVLAAPDATVIIDEHGDIVLINDQTERLLGYANTELVGQPVRLLIPAYLHKAHTRHPQDYFRAPQQLVGQRRDGTQLPIEVTLAPLDTDQGRLVSAAIRDITERREVEKALAQARDEALAAAQLKSQFVATVSHEIRTPMNGVIGLARLLLKTQLQANQRRYSEAILTSGRALLTIINDILDFSKIEAGRIELVEVDFELDQLLEEVILFAAETGREKGLEVLMYYPPDLPTALHGDQGRLRQALLNLLGNAVKFTEHGEVLLRAEPAPDSEDGRARITFAVVDTGIGIAAQDLARLCDPFSQIDAAPNRQFGGTGLGLTISRQLIDLMGGRLEVESRLGQGSQFSFTLPVALPQNPPVRPAHHKDRIIGRRLLIVDDNPTSRRLMTEHTQAWGMIPTAASDGGAALGHLHHVSRHQQPYDVAVIDQYMSGLDGIDLARQIIADPAITPMKMVLLTAGSHDDDDIAAAFMASGTVLPKPIGPSQLYNCLLELLDPAAVEAAGHVQLSPAQDPTTGSRGLILLAEDNRINQMVAVDSLTLLGYQVDVARNGLEVLQMVNVKPYQAILMDCQMPTMDGYTATAEIRHDRTHRYIPIIAMTAGALASDKDRCLAAGMDDYLTKPIDPDLLQAALSRWITETSTT